MIEQLKQKDTHLINKQLISGLNESMYNFEEDNVKQRIESMFAKNVKVHAAYPFETIVGRENIYQQLFAPLKAAIPDLEKRCYILIAGQDNGANWVGCAGYYTGLFWRDWLDIPPTGHQVTMRFHEFYRIEENQIVEVQILWDIPEVMHQANVWPMVPSLGKEDFSPAPASLDGILMSASDSKSSEHSLHIVSDMLTHLGKFATGGVAGMQLEKFWHARCSWYGPSGIGTCRGISGFRNWHQIPFLNALPNRKTIEGNGYLFADQNYVAFTAWPGMQMTVSGDGWLGIAPANQEITLRSLDFWRCEGDLIRENWVLVDILHAYHQLGVDVLARMKEFNKARFKRLSD